MVEVVKHAGITEWRFASVVSRLAGYTASAFLTSSGILIDTGIPARRRVFASLLTSAAVRGVIITHHHEDHAGNVSVVANSGLPLWLSPATLRLVNDVAPIRAYRRYTWRSMYPLRHSITPFDPAPLQLCPTPGHCADHHAVWDPQTGTLFSGDLFLGVAVRVAHCDEDPWQMMTSLEAMAALQPSRMFCAHRGLVLQPTAALRAKATWIRDTIDQISTAIARSRSDDQILSDTLGGESVTGWASGGEYSRRNFVRAVRKRLAAP